MPSASQVGVRELATIQRLAKVTALSQIGQSGLTAAPVIVGFSWFYGPIPTSNPRNAGYLRELGLPLFKTSPGVFLMPNVCSMRLVS